MAHFSGVHSPADNMVDLLGQSDPWASPAH